MSEEYSPEYEAEELESYEYEEIEEEISSDEVDRVLESLTAIMDSVESEVIQEYLAESYNRIFGLVYEEGDDTEDDAVSGTGDGFEQGPEAEAA